MKVTTAAVVFAAVALTAGGAVGQSEPNNDFASRSILDPEVRSVTDSLDPSAIGSGPDTTLGAFNQTGGVIEFNDDGSPYGDGHASALYDIAINTDGTIHLKVSGYPDCDFDGLDDYWDTPHEQAGDFDLYLTVLDAGGGQVDSQQLPRTLSAGNVLSFELSGYAAGSFRAAIDNTPNAADDPMDFLTFTGLTPGDHFEAEVAAGTFDTLLGWFDDAGFLLDYEDDGGQGQLSLLGGTVPDSGVVNLAVTGHPDCLFHGEHTQSGDYTLQVESMHPGDANDDGSVDYLDLGLLASHYDGLDKLWQEGDFNGDGMVDYQDLGVLACEYDWPAGGGAGVPEPAVLTLLGLLALSLPKRGGAALLRRKRS